MVSLPRWSIANLLVDVRRVAQLPAQDSASLDNASILYEANRIMLSAMVPLLLRTQEEFFVRRVSVTLTPGVANYPISRRAIGSRVRDVYLMRNGSRVPLPRIRPEQLGDLNPTASGDPCAFYVDASDVILIPTPASAQTLQMAIYVRPGTLQTTAAGIIGTATADSPTAGRTTLAFSALAEAPAFIDIISGSPPFEYKALDVPTASATTTGCNIATSALISPVVTTSGSSATGDYVQPPEQSFVPQIPLEAWGLFVQWTAASILRSLGYLEEANAAERKAEKMERDVVDVLTPRTDGSPSRVTGGLLRLINRTQGWR